jgi:enamine deaminase RidA (YjgF/YER057c/UK114 family)
MTILLPPPWPRPKGYSAGIAARGTTVYTSGMIGWDSEGHFVEGGMAEQTGQALQNIVDVLGEAGAGPEHVVRLTWYVTDRDEYLREQRAIGEAYRRVMGRNFPVMAVVVVSALVEAAAVVEIEATAVIPD